MIFNKTMGVACAIVGMYCGMALGDQYCYNTDPNPYRLYATKTRYDTVLDMKTLTHLNTSQIEGCEPSIFYLLARHGSRYESYDDIVLMTERLPQFQKVIEYFEGSLCKEDKEELKFWSMRMEESRDRDLAGRGWQELRDIARRFAQSYPDLVGVPYDENTFEFRHTERDRTRDSARAFVEGLFGSYDGIHMEQEKKSKDWLLFFYKNCVKYKAVLERNYGMYGDFQHGPEIEAVIARIQNRTGLLISEDEEMMDKEEVLVNLYLLYSVCIFEYQIYDDSPWCAIFTEEDLKVLEFGEDLEYYWEDGYGAVINYQQTCNLLKDLVYYLRLDEKEDSPTQTVVTRFAHSGDLNMLSSKLSLYKDDSDLTSPDYETSADRKWRTSHHAPMSGNLAFVRYDCSPNEEDKVAVYANEELVTLPVAGCTNGICPISALSNEWLPTTRTCDVHEICGMRINLSVQLTSSVTLVVISMIFTAFTNI